MDKSGTSQIPPHKGTMGFYPWDELRHGESYIHPDDVERWKKVLPTGKVFQCIDQDEAYITICDDHDCYRVRPEIYFPATEEDNIVFEYGDLVETLSGTKRVGVIRDIIWHSKHGAAMYFIREGNRKISKRYWEQDLRLISRKADRTESGEP